MNFLAIRQLTAKICSNLFKLYTMIPIDYYKRRKQHVMITLNGARNCRPQKPLFKLLAFQHSF